MDKILKDIMMKRQLTSKHESYGGTHEGKKGSRRRALRGEVFVEKNRRHLIVRAVIRSNWRALSSRADGKANWNRTKARELSDWHHCDRGCNGDIVAMWRMRGGALVRIWRVMWCVRLVASMSGCGVIRAWKSVSDEHKIKDS
jgi:hypothetical protein